MIPLMPDIYEEIGKQIRDLRTSVRGRGISQEGLARAVGTANTISRWSKLQTSHFRLGEVGAFFGASITAFFPEANPKSRTNALLSATTDLDDADLNEVRLYVLFRKSRCLAKRTK